MQFKFLKSSILFFVIFTLSLSLPSFIVNANLITKPEKASIEGYPISLADAIKLTLENNFDIQIGKIERKVNEYLAPIAKSIYNTNLTADFGYTVDKDEALSSASANKTNSTELNAGLSKKFSLGSILTLDFFNLRKSTSPQLYTDNPYYGSDAKISLRQPILKNALGIIDRGNIEIVELDISSLDLSILTRIEKNIAETQKAYWNLAFAYRNIASRKKNLAFAENFLKITNEQFENGALEETDLFAAQANLEQRKNELLEAKVLIENTSDSLKLTLNLFPDFNFNPTDKYETQLIEISKQTSLNHALNKRRDLKQAKLNLDKQNLQLKLDRNSKLPQIDLIGTYTANGIDSNIIDALGESAGSDNPTYFAGIEFTYSLENTKAKAKYSQSELNKAKAILDIKRIEKAIEIDIKKDLRNINLNHQQLKRKEKIAKLQLQKLQGEEKKYGFGRSSSDIILRYENDAINAHIDYIKAIAECNIALINLKQNQNTILDEVDWIKTNK